MEDSKPKSGLSRMVSRMKDKYREKRLSFSGASTPVPPTYVQPGSPTELISSEPKKEVNVEDLDPHVREQYEKTRRMFERYNLTMPPSEFPFASSGERIERVEKKIRMRVVRTCHRCKTTFGSEKVCTSCQHTRCKKCPRYPAESKKKGKTVVGTEGPTPVADATAIAVASSAAAAIVIRSKGKPYHDSRAPLLTRPPRVELQDRVRRPPKMRVVRTCHVCFVEFGGKAKQCAECGHPRCKSCPRVPPKLGKYPDGYPGDAEPEPPEEDISKRRVVFTCHQCSMTFAEGSKQCSSCSHELCETCDRQP
jgi:hypothetical protein